MMVSTNSVGLGAISACALGVQLTGEIGKADMLWRLAYASGEQGDELDAAIGRINEAAFARGPRFYACDRTMSTREISSASDAQEVLIEWFDARVTLPDILDLFDVGTPVVKLRNLTIDCSSFDNFEGEVTFGGDYEFVQQAEGAPSDAFIRHLIKLYAERGKVEVKWRDIEIQPRLRRLGMGTRSLLSLALFGRRHGFAGWQGGAEDEGRLVWPKLGAKIGDCGKEQAMEKLRSLGAHYAAFGRRIEALQDPQEIPSLRMEEGEVDDPDALREWMMRDAGLSEDEAELSSPPYPVGMLAVRSLSMFYVEYEIRELLDRLLQGMPDRIARLKRGSGEFDAPAGRGLADAYERARTEVKLLKTFIPLSPNAMEPDSKNNSGDTSLN